MPNAVILAAGTSSRFVPLSYDIPKGLIEVKGERLIERQIRQLKDAGVSDINIVTGYKAEKFEYLADKYDVRLIFNEDYAVYNNISSVFKVLDLLDDTFICSSDNYFPDNVFLKSPEYPFYSALFSVGLTDEYCLRCDENDNIRGVEIGGCNEWFMIGHVRFNSEFSQKFVNIIRKEYAKEDVRKGYWEDLYIKHLNELPYLKINRYSAGEILEFDSIDELRRFDSSYIDDTRSEIISNLAHRLDCRQRDLSCFSPISRDADFREFSFIKDGKKLIYNHLSDKLLML